MFWMALYAALLLFMGIYGSYVEYSVDRKYKRLAKKKARTHNYNDKAA